jgi:Domain of Unknown Function (DUF748)
MGGAAPTRQPTRRRRRWLWRVAVPALLIVLLLITAARLVLPWYLESYVNRVLDQNPEYDGRIGTVEVHLWRGAYAINDVQIVRTTNSVPVPFFEGRRVDFSLDWNALIHGVARGKMVMDRPRLNFVHGPTPEDTQTGAGQAWLGMIEDLFPFRIDEAQIVNGSIHFHTFHTDPPVNVYLSDVRGQVLNLTNVQDKTDPLVATVHATGTAMGTGRFEFDMSLDPQSHLPTFDLATRLLDVEVTRLNALTRAYGRFDFEGGLFDLVVELSTKDGYVEGYAKPLFRGVTVLGPRDLERGDPLRVFWEALVGIVGATFKNQSADQFGTRITLVGDIDDPRTNILEIIGNVLRNAFVRAYLPRLERGVAPVEVNPEKSGHGDLR